MILSRQFEGQQYALVCGLGLQHYVRSSQLAGELNEEGFANPLVAVSDILTICTEAHYPDKDWDDEILRLSDQNEYSKIMELVKIATECLEALPQSEEPGVAEMTVSEDMGFQALTTDFSAPGIPSVGSPEWHALFGGKRW